MTGVGERHGPLRRTGRWLTTPIRASWCWLTAQKSLGHALVIVVALGLLGAFVALVVVSWVLGQGWLWTSATQDTSRLDVTKLALTVVGGAGAIVALTVAYRRQKDVEDGRFTERFGAAAAQLGASTPAERLGGVYAMAGVAARYPAFAQQCIAVLCGYLRLPFDPDPAKTHLTQIVKHTIATGADSEPANTEDQTYQLLPNDREVRDSIVRVIAEHVRAHHETGWHENHFDLKGATLTTSDFSHSHFQGTFDCTGAKFTGRAVFDETQFNGAVFDDTTFNDLARFESSTFNRNATFKRATFNSGAWFFNATFNSDDVKRFEGAQFNSLALFNEAKLVANLRTATFNDLRATFRGLVVLPDGTR